MESGLSETHQRGRQGNAVRVFLTALVAVPALLLAALIYLYGFNLPFSDGWEECDLFHKVHQHTLTFDDLFIQHVDHRIFFPRLLFIGAFAFEPYTDVIELWIIWLLACLSSFCLWKLARQTSRSNSADLLLLAGANVLLFNLMAWEDWLWGFQIGFLLPILCVTAGVWLVSVSRGYRAFAWAFLWSVVNTFTVASGIITWIILLPLLLFPDGKFTFQWKGLFFHLFGFGVSLLFYLHGYTPPGPNAEPPFVVSAIPSALGYFLIYLGAPLADESGTIICLATGGFLVGLYLVCLGLIFLRRHEPDILLRTLPWLTLCHFAIGCAAITTVGRMGFGLAQALTSRYVVFSSLLPIGLLFAGAYLFPDLVERVNSSGLRQAGRRLLVALPILGFAFYLGNAASSISQWEQSYRDRLRTKAALVFINAPASAPILDQLAYPGVPALKKFLDLRIGLGVPQKILENSDISSLEETSPPDPKSGLVMDLSRSASGITVSGWAYLPKAGRAADLVLVTLPDSSNHDCLVKMAVATESDERIADAVPCAGDTLLHWSVVLPTETDLIGLKVWSFDGLEARAYRIPEAPNLR